MNASLKDWALYYAEKGLAVFPLEERGKGLWLLIWMKMRKRTSMDMKC